MVCRSGRLRVSTVLDGNGDAVLTAATPAVLSAAAAAVIPLLLLQSRRGLSLPRWRGAGTRGKGGVKFKEVS
jgi:hypothetical protein